MADEFFIAPYKVRSAGTDVPPEEVQTAINSLAQQTTVALNVLSTQSETPTGPAGGDLSGTYPNPQVSAVHATSGTLAGVAVTGGSVNNTPIGQTTPAAGAFTSLTATTPIPVTSGGTGSGTVAGARTNLGLGTIATQNSNNVTITGGTIDNTPIGQTTPGGGSFTTLNSTGGALNGTVGATTPNTGAFTTLNSTGGALNGTLGATTPSTVAATTVSATGTITPSATNGIVGTTTNNNANAGSVGETITATGSSVAIASATATNVTSISLTAGDWDVWGAVGFVPTTVTSISLIAASISPTSATQVAVPNITLLNLPFNAGNQGIVAPTQRISLATTTTYFLVATINFTGGTEAVSGTITARRRR